MPENPEKKKQKKTRPPNTPLFPRVIGHRGMGVGLHKKENRLAALVECEALSIQMAEVDVRISKDGVPVLHHEPEVDGSRIEETLLDSLLQLGIDSLESVLLHTTLALNLEIKYDSSSRGVRPYCGLILELVKRCMREESVVYSSFKRDICEEMRKHTTQILYLTEDICPDEVEYAVSSGLLGVVADAASVLLLPASVQWLKEMGLCVITYGSSNSEMEKVKQQFGLGVDSFITDDAMDVRRWIEEEMGICPASPLSPLRYPRDLGY